MNFPERAGWYDDPEDETQLRYFDGVVWSEHRVPRQAPSAPARVQADRDVFGRPAGHETASARQQPPAAWGTTPTGATTADGQRLAAFGSRVGAYLADTAILTVLVLITSGWAWWLFIADYWTAAMDRAMTGDPVDPMSMEEVSGYLDLLNYEYFFIAIAITILVQAVYGIGFLMAKGATPGKMMAGISVRRVDRPGPLGFGTAFMRMLLPMVLRVLWAMTCLVEVIVRALDLLWPLKDERRQALHDKIAGTQVVVDDKRS